MKKAPLALALALSASIFSSPAFSADATLTNPAIAVGHYFKEGLDSLFPLLANSTDGGSTWDYAIDSITPSLPLNFVQGSFNAASCAGLYCVAVGFYTNGSINFPLIANSTNGGVDWTYSVYADVPALPFRFRNGAFFSVSCSLLNCVAVGSYRSFAFGDFNQILIANSGDGGITWDYSLDALSFSSSVLELMSNRSLSSVSCASDNCVAVGELASHPLIISSSDGGDTWRETLGHLAPSLPSDFVEGTFYATSCSGLNCIAVGNYGRTELFFGLPLIASSQNGGSTWAYVVHSILPILPSGYVWGRFTGASCSGEHCVAAGYYASNALTAIPLIASSQDGGLTWVYALGASVPDLSPDLSAGQFSSVSCSGINCVAAGSYLSDKLYPLAAHSSDGGTSWTYVIDGATPSLPLGFQGGQLVSTNCKALNCIAAGEYMVDNITYPLLATSLDGGVTWDYTITRTTPSLPLDFVGGGFSNTEKSAASYLPAYLSL